MFLNASSIYEILIDERITQSQGKITFNFLDISVEINQKSAIGDLFHSQILRMLLIMKTNIIDNIVKIAFFRTWKNL